MKFEHVLELIKTVSDSKVTSFQYEEGETKLSIKVGSSKTGMYTNGCYPTMPISEPVSHDIPQSVEPSKSIHVETEEGNVVVSPLVGTFYVASSEEASPFVQVGDVVKKGQTLAIVEAMKLMNEIESDFDGVVTAILVENGKGVEYGQPLFTIK